MTHGCKTQLRASTRITICCAERALQAEMAIEPHWWRRRIISGHNPGPPRGAGECSMENFPGHCCSVRSPQQLLSLSHCKGCFSAWWLHCHMQLLPCSSDHLSLFHARRRVTARWRHQRVQFHAFHMTDCMGSAYERRSLRPLHMLPPTRLTSTAHSGVVLRGGTCRAGLVPCNIHLPLFPQTSLLLRQKAAVLL